MRTLPLLLLLVLLAALAGGCTRSATTQIRNPAQIGYVEPNKVVISYARIESNYGLPPGSLNEEASLVSYDPSGACFNVSLNNLEDAAALADIAAYDIQLLADDSPLPPGTVQPGGVTATVHQGLVPETQQTGTSTSCVRTNPNTQACEQWDTQPTYSTYMVPGPVTVYSGAGNVCFPNNGALHPGTQEVALEFRSAANVPRHRFTFEWRFLGTAPAPAAQGQARASR
jgi:hypothetical protein